MIKRFLMSMWDWARPYLTLKMIPCLLISWLITNGWAYVFAALGPVLGWSWMTVAGSAWIAILWMPWTLEKPLITIPLACLIYRLIYREKFVKKVVNDVNRQTKE